MSKQYWVVGGEYRDTDFRELSAGRPEAHGPFGDYEQALAVWRERAESTRSCAYHRYTIAVNAAG
ncbi:MAG: hypothetical protein OHK0024_31350 [Thalassobaculales bacterium]